MKITNIIIAAAALSLVHAVRLGNVATGKTGVEAEVSDKMKRKARLSGGGGSTLRR